MFREMDESGEIKSGTFIYKQDSVGANIATQIQLWARENPQDYTDGIDWKSEFANWNKGRLSAQIRDIAFRCAHVTAVSQKVNISDPDENHQVMISFNVRTEYGDIAVGVPVNA